VTTTTDGPRSATPPRGLMRWLVNPVVRSIARSPAGRWTGDLLLLEFTGRRSGRRLSVPVVGRRHGEALYALTDATWALNFSGGAAVQVASRGRRWAATGVLVSDQAEAAAVLRTAIATSGARHVGLSLPQGWTGTDAELCTLRRAVRLEETGPAS
jgi:F420H(2)-dependent quinone reductase